MIGPTKRVSPLVRTTLRQMVLRFWPIIALVVVILAFTTTLTPALLTIGAPAVGVGSYFWDGPCPRAVSELDLADRPVAARQCPISLSPASAGWGGRAGAGSSSISS